jgi:hypothetical protein
MPTTAIVEPPVRTPVELLRVGSPDERTSVENFGAHARRERIELWVSRSHPRPTTLVLE